MKVLVWTQYFWPETFHINEVVRELVRQGISVTVLTGKPNYPEGKVFEGYRAYGTQTEFHEGVEIIRLPLFPRGQGSAIGLILNYLSFVLFGYLLAPWSLRGKKFDRIFVYAPSPILQALPAIFLSHLKKAPLILWVQDIWPDALRATGYVENRTLLAIVGFFVRIIYRFSDLILIQSEGFRTSVEFHTKGKAKIREFSNSAINPSGLEAKANASTEFGTRIAQCFSLVFAGNIGSAQSCETIIQAANSLRAFKDIKFFLIGSGSKLQELRRLVSSLGLTNVEMPGRMNSDQMPAIYSETSVLLLSLADDVSLSRTIPSKLQGYLAAGKPIIASCNGEAASVVQRANAGLTCGAGDVLALVQAIEYVYKMDAPERLKFGVNGRRFYDENYSLQKQISRLIEHFQSTKPLVSR